jgi:predicted alpha/beta hydrolase family esterase
MKKQVVVIHGGGIFASYEEFLKALQSKEVDLKRLKPKDDWKMRLQAELGDDFDVLTPRMPNSDNAQYREWRIWFEKIIPFLNEEVVLIGHSLGGIFLAKYLSENDFPKKIDALFLVAAPYDEEDRVDAMQSGFVLGEDLLRVSGQVKEIFLYHSKEDEVVPFADFEKYRKAFPHAHAFVFEGRGHFTDATFPELTREVKSLRE